MPIYEYECETCSHGFELLIRANETAACPQCGGLQLHKQFSVPAAHSAGSSLLPICPPRQQASGCGLPQCGSGGCQML
jgi:putative FmdB family regulatory protein